MKRPKSAALAVACGLLTATAAQAVETVSEQTSCRSVRAIFDAEQPDKMQIRAVIEVIERTFADLDRRNAVKGRARIYARMSDQGKKTTAAVVTSRCDDHPTDTLRQSAETVYKTFEAMGDALGANR